MNGRMHGNAGFRAFGVKDGAATAPLSGSFGSLASHQAMPYSGCSTDRPFPADTIAMIRRKGPRRRWMLPGSRPDRMGQSYRCKNGTILGTTPDLVQGLRYQWMRRACRWATMRTSEHSGSQTGFQNAGSWLMQGTDRVFALLVFRSTTPVNPLWYQKRRAACPVRSKHHIPANGRSPLAVTGRLHHDAT